MNLRRLIRRILLVVASVVVLFVLYAATKGYGAKELYSIGVQTEPENPFVLTHSSAIVAHRLGKGLYPEGTMMAAEGLMEAVDNGELEVDTLEIDIYLSKDNHLVILHDSTLDRTTDSMEHFGKKDTNPHDYTLEELKELNFGEGFVTEAGETPYKGLRGSDIPESLRAMELEELLTYLEENGRYSYIFDVKDGGKLGEKALDELVRIMEKLEITDRTIVGSFSESVLTYLDSAYPFLHRTASYRENFLFFLDYLLGRTNKTYPYSVIDTTPRFSPIVRTGLWGKMHGLFSLSSQGYINFAHKKGLAVYYWTVNDEAIMRRLMERNADGIITDYPNRATDVRNSLR